MAAEVDFRAVVRRGGGGRGGGQGGQGGGTGGGDNGDDGGKDVDSVSRTQCEADLMTLAAMDDSVRLDRIEDAANRAVASFYPVLCARPRGRPDAERQASGGGRQRRARSGVAHGRHAAAGGQHRRHVRDEQHRARWAAGAHLRRHERIRPGELPLGQRQARWEVQIHHRPGAPSGRRHSHAPRLPWRQRRRRPESGWERNRTGRRGVWRGRRREPARGVPHPDRGGSHRRRPGRDAVGGRRARLPDAARACVDRGLGGRRDGRRRGWTRDRLANHRRSRHRHVVHRARAGRGAQARANTRSACVFAPTTKARCP